MLQVSGLLNPEAGGPGFRDVAGHYNEGTTYYTPFDKDDDPSLNRRSIYRFSPRGQRSAILETFDCPDPATTTPSRSVTTTPLQALALLNNAFVLRMADGLAKRVEHEAGTDPKNRWNVFTNWPIGDHRMKKRSQWVSHSPPPTACPL